MKKILVINGHPTQNSFCNTLSNTYAEAAASAGHELAVINLYDLNFSPNLAHGYSKRQEPEPDILLAQQKIKWANHIVIVHPVWWGSLPALLKGFLDTALLPGFAFKYRTESLLWDKLLSGRTARIIYTADTPVWIYHYFFGAPSVRQLKHRTLVFCGIKPVKVTGIGPIRKSRTDLREARIEKIRNLGLNAV